jgi:hypothetical protein
MSEVRRNFHSGCCLVFAMYAGTAGLLRLTQITTEAHWQTVDFRALVVIGLALLITKPAPPTGAA